MTKEKLYYLGIDIGSTTAKIMLLDHNNKVVYQKYQRHMSRVRETTLKILSEMRDELFCEYSDTDSHGEASENSRVNMEKVSVKTAISGSAGLGVAESAGISFVQEVYATGEVVSKLAPDTGVVIELGGEDAKVIFYKGGVDERMNGTCAGGTGAFIDQMAVLLDMTADEMDAESLKATRIYPIA